MPLNSQSHCLLILSQDFEVYQHLIQQAELPGLSIQATNDSKQACQIGTACDLVLGEPSAVCQVVNSLLNLEWVQATWAGVEPLLTPGIRRDYLLTNARNVYGPMMSEYVFAYLLAIERRILPRWQAQMAGKWDHNDSGRLKGKLLGLLGVGSIGAHLAKTSKHFGLRVRGYTRQSMDCPDIDKYFHADQWPRFTSDLDYLVCTLPSTLNTKGLVNAAFLSSLPRKAWIINVGRGSTVDENALADCLCSGSIAGAVLDVFDEEPLPAGHRLWSTPNTFITSHTAALNYLPDIASLFIDNYKRLISGQPLSYQVDFDQVY